MEEQKPRPNQDDAQASAGDMDTDAAAGQAAEQDHDTEVAGRASTASAGAAAGQAAGTEDGAAGQAAENAVAGQVADAAERAAEPVAGAAEPAAEPVAGAAVAAATVGPQQKWAPLDDAEPVPVPRRRSRWKTAGLVSVRTVAAVLSVAVLTATGISWATVSRIEDNVTTTNLIDELGQAPNAPEAKDGATDILLVGSDSRTDAEGNPLPAKVLKQLRTEANDGGVNTDTIIVLRVPDDGRKATAFSIPRDTYTTVPGIGEEKINSAYTRGKNRKIDQLRAEGVTEHARLDKEGHQAGRLALALTVQELTGLRIDRYAEVNLYGFYLLTEAVGGVDVCLRRSTSDPDSGASFRAGPQTISGGDALAFVRQRNGLPRSDLDRIVRQQAFMAAVVSKILSSGTLTNPGKLGALMTAAKKSIVMDSGWDPLQFAQQMQGLAGGNVEFRTIPVTGVGARNERGQSVVTVNRDQVRSFVAGLTKPEPPASPQPPPSSAPPPSSPPARLGGAGAVRLDGVVGPPGARQQPVEVDEPITANGVRCVY
ncbi:MULTISPECIES: LCP family protein [unclassified Crossiella]|uniref:LCP family protein n=1 Tax=unclassified Crossiella TaxID=2620835 RepID=UPI001FFED27A|nr:MULTISPECIES: LCP family protein [unclassified Crossiella]MCK2238416.1 LCP family protein [Crossiella sp. S99.2]MCK2256456.1 LCP family protein [Crossiella sp. S99.1]